MTSSPRGTTLDLSKGFTLIELLVVIAIIGLLSSIVLASLNTARAKGQDAARISDTKSIETAMELYYNDHNSYPSSGEAAISALSSALVPAYIGSIPAVLVADGDRYYGPTSSSYGLLIYTAALPNFCVTGIQNQGSGWWGEGSSRTDCNF